MRLLSNPVLSVKAHRFLVIFFIFAWVQCRAQHEAKRIDPDLKGYLSEIKSIDMSDTNYTDLKGLAAAIGNARIVMLGEQTHGEGSVFSAKSRIIRFLYETMGFEVFAIESGMYDITRIWENTTHGSLLAKEAPGSMFRMYAHSKQMQPLFSYIQHKLPSPRPLVVAGFDSQHTGTFGKTLMLEDLNKFLQTNNGNLLDNDWDVFKKVTTTTMGNRNYRPTEEEKKIFFSKTDALKKWLPTMQETGVQSFLQSPGFWYRIVCSIESQAQRYWMMVSGNEISVRDVQMAENIIWLAEKAYPGKKIIVWAHNGHIAKKLTDLRPLQPSPMAEFMSTFAPMGTALSKHFGNNLYTIGFTGSAGSYIDFNDNKLVNVPPVEKGSIEEKLASTGYDFGFVNYSHAKGWLNQPFISAAGDFVPLKGIWPDVFDGLFYIRKATPTEPK